MRYEDAVLSDGVAVVYCEDCGVLVWDATAHDGWHADMALALIGIGGRRAARHVRGAW